MARTVNRLTPTVVRNAKQTFDHSGECEHKTVAFDPSAHIVWSTRDECIFCGAGREWR